MVPQAAFIFCIVFVVYLFRADSKYRPNISYALWIPLIWMLIIGTRPIDSWLNSGQETYVEITEARYVESDPISRNIFILLIILGIYILSKRKINWLQILQSNLWIILLFSYYGISILWSDFPFISFKRWIKEVGSLVMVLVVLTESNPVEGIKTIFARFAYLLIPLSVVLIEYYPALGIQYDPLTDITFYTGVSNNKNGLGCIVLVSGIFFFGIFLQFYSKKMHLL